MNTQKTIQHSKEQLEIFAWFAGTILSNFRNLIISAYAGTGKTFTLINAFLHAPEKTILYCVFNKKNQLEAQGKISDSRVQVSTLHSVGYKLIARAWGRIKANGYAEWNRVTTVCPELKDKKYMVANIAKLISTAKNFFAGVPSLEDMRKLCLAKDCEPSDKDQSQGWTVDKICEIAMQAMELSKQRAFEISFDDMVWLPVAIDLCKPEFDLICGDEWQDAGVNQVEIISRLVKPNGRLCFVGDDFQAIYGFRGAQANQMQACKKRFNATELKLTQTFRCPQKVVEKARQYVSDYTAHPDNYVGEVMDISEEKMIEQADIGQAILSRVNAPLMRLCLAFIRKGKPAKIEGKDIARDLKRIAESIGGTWDNFEHGLDVWAQAGIAKATGRNASQRIELISDQADTLKVLAEVSSSLNDLCLRLDNLFQDSQSEYAKPAICLSSVHKAKGLEWRTVYLLNETFFKSRPGSTAEQAEEEKHIHYVAITRSQANLYFVATGKQGPSRTDDRPDDAQPVAKRLLDAEADFKA